MPGIDLTYRAFYVDFAVTGRIFGAGPGARRADWPPVLGEHFFEASWKPRHLVRQFGFVEVNFDNGTGEWICDTIALKPENIGRFADMVPVWADSSLDLPPGHGTPYRPGGRPARRASLS